MGLIRLFCILSTHFLFINGVPHINYVTKYIDMPVDHFSFSNDYKFKLRYLENNKYWKPESGAPIFFYTGNEGDITNFANNTGFVWEIAPHFNALIIFAEHRYYGESLPFGNRSYSDKRHTGYLSSSQALADYVDLIAHIKNVYKVKQNMNPVIAFGGSYGGMLSAWIRMKYPSSIAGSIAASAPIWQFTGMTPCNAFNNVVSSVFNSTSSNCFASIKRSWAVLDSITASDDGREWLTSTFKMCKPIQSSNDLLNLKYWLSDVYAYLAMVNYPYPANFVADLPAHPVKACTEMVMPMCDDGKSMFEKYEWNFNEYSNGCFIKYGVRPQKYLVEKFYGGKNINSSSNIIFSNGLLDPWSSGGVLSNISKSLIAVVIPDGAHHLDLRSSNPADPKSIKDARILYVKTIKQWIKRLS